MAARHLEHPYCRCGLTRSATLQRVRIDFTGSLHDANQVRILVERPPSASARQKSFSAAVFFLTAVSSFQVIETLSSSEARMAHMVPMVLQLPLAKTFLRWHRVCARRLRNRCALDPS